MFFRSCIVTLKAEIDIEITWLTVCVQVHCDQSLSHRCGSDVSIDVSLVIIG